MSPRAAYPRCPEEASGYGSCAYPEAGLTPRPPDAPRAARRPNGRRAPSYDSSAPSEKTRDTLPRVPLTARERSVCSPEEVRRDEFGGSGSSGFSTARGARSDRSESRRPKAVPAADKAETRLSRSQDGEKRSASRTQKAHRAPSPRHFPSSPGSTATTAAPSQGLSGRGSPAPSGAGHNESAGALSLASSQAGPEGASSFQSIMDEIERDREMWTLKSTALRNESRPGTASRPGTSSQPVKCDQTEAQLEGSELPDEEEGKAPAELPKEVSFAEPKVEITEEVKALELEVDLGESLIATAMRNAGLDPESIAISELVVEQEEATPQEDAIPEEGTARWQMSSKNWAAERARRKKERCSGAGTPCGSGRQSPA